MIENRRIELGIDGNCGFALLGDDIHCGECEFVEIIDTGDQVNDQLLACKQALKKLRSRLSVDTLYYFGTSHPYGR